MSVIKVKRGLDANLPTSGINVGELYFTTDTKKLLIGDSATSMVELANLRDVLEKDDNLSSLVSKPTSRTNLGVYSKDEVDSLVTGMQWGQVLAATTVNITLSGAQTIDGVSIGAGDRILVKNQTDATENGIYVAATGSWTRATDADTGSELASAAMVVEDGTENGNTAWICTNTSITLGTTEVTFMEFPTGNITPGTALTKSGNTLHVDITTLEWKDVPTTIEQDDTIMLWDGYYEEHVKVKLSDILSGVYTLAAKIKYDAEDGSPGYLGEKVVAGTGISLAKVSGTRPNSLQINFNWADFDAWEADIDADNDFVLFKDVTDGAVKQASVNTLIANATIDGGSF